MQLIETAKYTFPTWALCALVYGTADELEPKDRKLFKEFLERESYIDHFISDDWVYFSKSPEFGLACECVDVTGYEIRR